MQKFQNYNNCLFFNDLYSFKNIFINNVELFLYPLMLVTFMIKFNTVFLYPILNILYTYYIKALYLIKLNYMTSIPFSGINYCYINILNKSLFINYFSYFKFLSKYNGYSHKYLYLLLLIIILY